MSEQEKHNDADFKHFLEIVRSYLCQIQDQDIIELCSAWVQKLCNSKRNEKVLRNKYIFSLCYQLAKGVLEAPFVNKPDFDELPPLFDQIYEESSEMECILVDLDNTKIAFDNEVSSATNNCLDNSKITKSKANQEEKSEEQGPFTANSISNIRPNISLNLSMTEDTDNISRTANLIMKIRNMKEENLRLREALALHKESQMKNKYNELYDKIKLDSSTSTYFPSESSSTTLKSLKSKLEVCQTSRNQLIENISNLKEKLNNFEDMKKYDIEDLQAKHKTEIMQIETAVREELKAMYEKNLAEAKSLYKDSIITIEKTKQEEIQNITTSKDVIISQRDTIINKQNEEIAQLKLYIEDLKRYQILNDIPQRTDLEKHLNILDKSKNKCCKAYEAKILNLKKDKHLAECSLQLQLMKQRAKIINDVTNEHEKDISSALEKLENKYKDIVASVQATAVQRKILDQMALETLIQSMCGIRKDAQTEQTISQNQLNATILHSRIEPREKDFSTVTQRNGAGSVIVGNNCPATDNDCYFRSVKIEEEVTTPQRDLGCT